MMSKPTTPPVVAELGRPETPEETAARKAEFSAAYRSSQSARHLVAAILVTLGMLALIVLMVPRGEPVARPGIDVAVVAENVSDTMGPPVVVADTASPELAGIAETWRANTAELTSTGTWRVWEVNYAVCCTGEDDDVPLGFVYVAQGFGADQAWALVELDGARPDGAVSIAGSEWDSFRFARPDQARNVSTAIGIQAGDDYVLLYGSLPEDAMHALAEQITPQVHEIARFHESAESR